MKRSILAAVVLSCTLAFALGVLAQQAAPKEHSMTGCLKAGDAPNTYMLTDVDKVETIGVVSSTANLKPHVGHKIEVTGTAMPAKDAEAENKDVPKAKHYMKLTAIKMVSTTCP
jgi:hypothetical protein